MKEEKEKQIYIAIYDISNTKVRSRMSKYLEGYGSRIQESVFELKLTEKKYNKMLKNLPWIDETTDDFRICRIYPESVYMKKAKEELEEDEELTILFG